MTGENKALVLLDGSKRALMTMDYIASMQMFHSMKLVLYSVLSGIPEDCWGPEFEVSKFNASHAIGAWEKQRKEQIEKYMETARQVLIAKGFSKTLVEVKIHYREKGIIQDILNEAQAGYQTVVLRRQGMGELEGVALGSIASNLLSKLTFLPLQVAGRKEQTNKILIGVDGSPSSTQAVNFIAENIGNGDYTVCLVYVIPGFSMKSASNTEFMMTEQNIGTAEAYMQEHFKVLKEKLVSSGLRPENILEKIITGVYSRAGAIVMEAECGNYSTIVVGRHGQSRVREFFMGKVCRKVVQAGRYHTVWII